jgi:hypothetical protein
LVVLLASTAASPPEIAGSSYDVISEARTGAVVDATVYVFRDGRTHRLGKEGALTCLREFLSEHTVRPGLLKLAIFTYHGDVAKYGSARPRDVRSLQQWLDEVKALPAPQGEIAEVVKSPKGTLLRYRPNTGEIQRYVIDGEDPAIVKGERATYEILHFVVAPIAPVWRTRPGGGRRVDIYFRVKGKLDVEECRSMTVQLSKTLDLPLVFTRFRPDPFFVYADTFPLLHPLLKYSELPSKDTWQDGKMVVCPVTYNEVSCHIE